MRINQFLIAIGVGTMLAACSSKEDYTTEVERIPIRINASIEGNLVGTRAVENSAKLHGTSFVDGEQFNLNIVYTGTNTTIPSFEENGNFTPKYNNGSLDIGEDVFYPLDGRAIDVFSSLLGDGRSPQYISSEDFFSVIQNQSSDVNYRMSDFMCASAENCVGGTINLTFSHLMSKIIVNLSGYEGTASDYSVTIKQVQTYTKLDNNDTKDVSLGNTPENEKEIANILMGNYDDAGVTAIVIPQTISNGKELFEVKIGSSTYQYTTDKEINFVSGNVYTFNLNFNGSAITTGTISIAPWTGKDASDHKYDGTLQ